MKSRLFGSGDKIDKFKYSDIPKVTTKNDYLARIYVNQNSLTVEH